MPDCCLAACICATTVLMLVWQACGQALAQTPGIATGADQALNGLFCAPPCAEGGSSALTRTCTVAAWITPGVEHGSSFDRQVVRSSSAGANAIDGSASAVVKENERKKSVPALQSAS